MEIKEKELKNKYTKLRSRGVNGNVYLNSDKTEIIKIFKNYLKYIFRFFNNLLTSALTSEEYIISGFSNVSKSL